jgi:type VI secretion system protein ImpF
VARNDLTTGIQQSVLDRLVGGGESMHWEASLEQLKSALRRDLEWLLNTRRTIVPLPEDAEELPSSVFNFGLPDLTSMSKDDPETRHRLLRYVEEAVGRFEPRLTDVRVSIMLDESRERRELHFMIEGLLRRDPVPEEVAFDTVLRIVTGEIEVRGDADEK